MPLFSAEPLEMMASFRSAAAEGQLMAAASAALSRKGGYVRSGEVENAQLSGKGIGPAAKIL
jgi:predicted NAD/FAD-dependent oxidoreductase